MAAFVDYGMEAAADCNVLGRKRKTLDLAILRASLEYVLGLVYYRLCILCQIKKRFEYAGQRRLTAHRCYIELCH